MPFGEYKDFDDCLSKNSDKDDPSAYCGYIKNQVEEALLHKEAKEAINKAIEQDPNANEPEGLTTPDAGNQNEEQVQDLTSPQGSSKEAENDQASGDGELSPADPPQDEAEPEANPQDQAKPENVTTTEVSPDSEIITNDKYGKLNGDKYAKNEDELKDERRDEHQSLEYNGETYHRVNAIEFEDEIYTQKDDKEEAEEDDIEFEDKDFGKADNDVLELDDDFYVKDNEQAPMTDVGTDVGQPAPQTAIDVPELNPIMESVIIRESTGKYRKYNVFQAKETFSPSRDEVLNYIKNNPNQNGTEIVKGLGWDGTEDTDVPILSLKDEGKLRTEGGGYVVNESINASDEVKAVEKIIIKEKGKLKFKSVYTEVKKKA